MQLDAVCAVCKFICSIFACGMYMCVLLVCMLHRYVSDVSVCMCVYACIYMYVSVGEFMYV